MTMGVVRPGRHTRLIGIAEALELGLGGTHVLCIPHNEVVPIGDLTDAAHARAHPEEWCRQCRSLVTARHHGELP
jgi:hypothetical protein